MASKAKRLAETASEAPPTKDPEPAPDAAEAIAGEVSSHASKPKRSPPGKVTLEQITGQLKKIAKSGQAHEAAAGLQVARAALMDIARLNGLEPEGPAAGTVTWEELLAAIPDDDDPAAADRGPEGDAGAGGQARPPEA